MGAHLPHRCIGCTSARWRGAWYAQQRQPCTSGRSIAATVPAGHIDLRSSEFYTSSAACCGRGERVLLRPAEMGADPSGKLDSVAAFEAVLAAAWRDRSGHFTNGPDNSAIIDLEGGTYSFSRPVVFPAAGGGGVTMRDGVIRAAPSFPDEQRHGAADVDRQQRQRR